MLEMACRVIEIVGYRCPEDTAAIIKQYTENDYKYDYCYRKFYDYYDRIEARTDFETLRERAENIYTNIYLDRLTVSWSNALCAEKSIEAIPGQERFYRRCVAPAKERVVVIISDALRYETAAELADILSEDEKCGGVHLDVMYGVLPSVTKLGMAALLPHGMIEIDDNFKVSVDGRPCDTLSQREAVLQSEVPNGRCLQYDDVMAAKREEVRTMFGNKEVVYVYHNQIDARGDKANTENEVFSACAESVNEIRRIVRRLTEDVSARHFIITADHGFIYKRDRIGEYDKISGRELKGFYVGKRYVIGRDPIEAEGVKNYEISASLGGRSLNVAVPSGTSIFKTAGGGQNYVHGGTSPQEMLIPVLDVRTAAGHQETRPAAIDFISTMKKITSLAPSLEFYQMEPVTDVVKEAVYKLFFISEDNEKISNEVTFEAKSRAPEAEKRFELTLDAVRGIAGTAGGFMGKVLAALRVHHIRVYLPVHGQDAAATALAVGRLHAVLGAALGALQNFFRLEFAQYELEPDYTGENAGKAFFSCKITAHAIIMLIACIWALVRLKKQHVI